MDINISATPEIAINIGSRCGDYVVFDEILMYIDVEICYCNLKTAKYSKVPKMCYRSADLL